MPEKPAKTIAAYERKRDFERTPEPPSEGASEPGPAEPGTAAPAAAGPRFVAHRHEARRLHYDLRLEMHGVLKSWAVPKGFCYDPEVKKLAVRTEDHPLAYTEFEGVIPEGEYGGGTMVVWDRGRYQITEGGEDQGGGRGGGGKAGRAAFGKEAPRRLAPGAHQARRARLAPVQGSGPLRPGRVGAPTVLRSGGGNPLDRCAAADAGPPRRGD